MSHLDMWSSMTGRGVGGGGWGVGGGEVQNESGGGGGGGGGGGLTELFRLAQDQSKVTTDVSFSNHTLINVH